MRGPRLFLFFPLEIGEDQKKGLHVRRCRLFIENIGEDQRKMVYMSADVVFSLQI